MPDWLITYLGSLQGGIVRTLAAEMRAGGLGTAWLAFGLGALHALTPGHGKAALAAYFLGREARIGKGVRIALMAASRQSLIFVGHSCSIRLIPSSRSPERACDALVRRPERGQSTSVDKGARLRSALGYLDPTCCFVLAESDDRIDRDQCC
jgi:hypothetical protein